MDMLFDDDIAAAGLADWRKLAQGLHARFLVDDFTAAARFVAAVAQVGDEIGHHPRVTITPGYVDLKAVSTDAVYRDGQGAEHVVEWVTRQDLDLAARITQVAAAHGLRPDPAAVTQVELGLDTPHPAQVAPVWAALLTGDLRSQGRGSIDDEVRDATDRVPHLWFGTPDEPDQRRFHVEVYVPADVVGDRVAAVVAAGGMIVDDSRSPDLTVVADPDGNTGVICGA